MKLSKALEKHSGKPFDIPDCSRDDLPQLFTEMDFKSGAEVGVYKGGFSKLFCEAGLAHHAIDPWREYNGFTHPRGQARLDFQYEHTQRLLSPYKNCKIIRKTSMEAVEGFKNESLDYVYLDGNHNFRFVAEDLAEWTQKVRKGGIVSGHDYCYVKRSTGRPNWEVAYVLQAYLRSTGINNWYLLGRENEVSGEKRDQWRSWMFLKP